ncbi:MAG: LysR family transcriptional regulator [Clostridia bacterium]|nr:LysR family transcriptional regulator [Clostridia bacterium]
MFQYEEYVYAVYKEKSFTRAADRLFVSQPALSATVKKQEERLGFKIFERGTPSLSLTEEGEVYIRAIERLHALKTDLGNQIMDISSLQSGSLTVAGANFISSFVLSEIIERFTALYPGIEVNLIESNSKELESFVIEDKVDIVFDYTYNGESICGEPLLRENILLAVPAKNPLNGRLSDIALTGADIRGGKHLLEETPAIDLGACEGESFLILKPGNSMHHIAKALLTEAAVNHKTTIQLDQLMTAYNMCGLGMGLTFLSDTLIKSVAENAGICYYKLRSSHASRMLYMEYKKHKYVNRAMRRFMSLAAELYS